MEIGGRGGGVTPEADPPRHGEGDRREAVVEGVRHIGFACWNAPSTMLRMVPLPLQGRINNDMIQCNTSMA
ncbi:hypothetical protein ASF14_04690 [Sphingomonas sp. Leaf257]|nr:hypothetical protein ASF14_04690 [Sphingomonas sp. Leaf257]